MNGRNGNMRTLEKPVENCTRRSMTSYNGMTGRCHGWTTIHIDIAFIVPRLRRLLYKLEVFVCSHETYYSIDCLPYWSTLRAWRGRGLYFGGLFEINVDDSNMSSSWKIIATVTLRASDSIENQRGNQLRIFFLY